MHRLPNTAGPGMLGVIHRAFCAHRGPTPSSQCSLQPQRSVILKKYMYQRPRMLCVWSLVVNVTLPKAHRPRNPEPSSERSPCSTGLPAPPSLQSAPETTVHAVLAAWVFPSAPSLQPEPKATAPSSQIVVMAQVRPQVPCTKPHTSIRNIRRCFSCRKEFVFLYSRVSTAVCGEYTDWCRVSLQ